MSVRFSELKITNQVQRNLFVSQAGEVALNKKWESYPKDDSHYKSNYNLQNKKKGYCSITLLKQGQQY